MKRFHHVVTVFLLSWSLAACGSTSSEEPDGSGACEPPDIVGAPFASTGTATLVGTGTLPEGIPDGNDLQLLLGTDTFSVSILPENLFAPRRTCGRTVTYTISQVEAGTYTLEFGMYDTSWASTTRSFRRRHETTRQRSWTLPRGGEPDNSPLLAVAADVVNRLRSEPRR